MASFLQGQIKSEMTQESELGTVYVLPVPMSQGTEENMKYQYMLRIHF